MRHGRPLLLFDSGVGGLSVLAAIRRELPDAPIVYAADNAGFPYGTRSAEEIEIRIPALLGRLAERYDPMLVVIACNTASTIALDAVRSALELPVVGTVPAIKPAASISKTRTIGILGTAATIVQPYVDRLAADFAADCTVIRYGSAELVDLAEAKLRGRPGEAARYRAILGGLLDQPAGDRIDTIVLACTHFPLVVEELMAASSRPIAFVDGSEGIARRTASITAGETWPARHAEDIAVFTADLAESDPLRQSLAGFGLVRIDRL